ncbi:unnamed protein product [Staurois parvus]|uniref:Uncharacterized protein n=1 Tax=Staurois parvus TaxID=386267 RepID=A0ABN9FQX5_9NEOB|nr:unnamed protein product [Staurois parvus]
MVKGCYSQSLYYEGLRSYHIVPYTTDDVLYQMGYNGGHMAQHSQLLIYRMKE